MMQSGTLLWYGRGTEALRSLLRGLAAGSLWRGKRKLHQDRPSRQNTDGTPFFATDYDKANETEVCNLLARVWKCDLHPFGLLCPVDFYAIRHGRMVGVLELKSRSHESTRYPTVFLNVRKWLALLLAQIGLGVPAVFVVKFLDGVFFLPIDDIDARRVRMGGVAQIVKSPTDIEPMIEVAVNDMIPVKDSNPD